MALILGGGKTGGSLPATGEDFVGAHTSTIANGSNGRVDFLKLPGGSALLDLTDPSIPVAVASGAYAISVSVVALSNMTVGGFFSVVLELDSDGADVSAEIESRLATAAKPQPKTALAGSYPVPAGGTFRVKVYNFDGANSIDFSLASAFVQFTP